MRSVSLKDSPNLSRKEKIDVFELKINEIDDVIPEMDDNLIKLEEEVAELKSHFQKEIDQLKSEKYNRSEALTLLPK